MIDFLQKINNFLYSHFGLNSITLKIQVYINTKRNKKDQVDTKELINDIFVQ